MTKVFVTFAFALSICFTASPVPPVTPQSTSGAQFSADLSMTRPSRQPVQGRIYFGASKWRFDVNSQDRAGSMIFDMERHVVLVLMPQAKMFMEVRTDAPGHQPLTMPDIRPVDFVSPCKGTEFTACRKLGPDIFDGRPCDNWEYVSAGITRVACLDRRVHVYIRVTGSDGSRLELHHVTEGPQTDGLFQVPAGFQKWEPKASGPATP